MRFHARSLAKGLERPLEIYGQVLAPLRDWAVQVAKFDGQPVEILEAKEQLRELIQPPEDLK